MITTTEQNNKNKLALYALTIGAFGIGTTEFVIMGLLPQISLDFGVSLSAAGMLITGYALGVVVGAPLLTAISGRFPQKSILVALMAIFTLGNLLCAIAPNYDLLMIARIFTSFSHGAFFGIGSVVATTLVPANKQASAIAIMFTGLTAANVLGVPFGTWLGQNLGWRSTFWAVTAIGPLAMLGLILFVSKNNQKIKTKFKDELKVLVLPQVMLSFLTTILGFGGVFTIFTYIAPLLTDITGFKESLIAPILVLFGAGLILGNLLGGKWADKKLMTTLIGSLIALSATMFLITLFQQNQILTLILVGLLGITGFATVPPLQMRVLEKAKGAPTLASAFNIAAFNLGNALGAWAGGLTIDSPLGLAQISTVAGTITLLGIFVALFSVYLEKKNTKNLKSI